MIFNKEETKNLLNMLRSSDKENAILAFESLKRVDIKTYIGELIVLYKFGNASPEDWETNCPKIWKKIKDMILGAGPLTSPKCLTLLKNVKANNDCMELFMELFVKDMIGYLDDLGYPADKFDISIKFKN